MTAIETATAFCRAWFEQRDPAKALTFVSDNVDFAGTAKNECAHSAAELGAYIRGDIAEIAEPFTCSLNADTWEMVFLFILLTDACSNIWVIQMKKTL